MVWFIIWFFLGVATGFIAKAQGRSPGGWFIYGFLLFPIAIVHLMLSDPARSDAVAETRGTAPSNEACEQCGKPLCPEDGWCRDCGRNRSQA